MPDLASGQRAAAKEIDQVLLPAHAGGLKQGSQVIAGGAPRDAHFVGGSIQAMKGEQHPGKLTLAR